MPAVLALVLVYVIFIAAAMKWNISLAPGLSIKNALLYALLGLLVANAVIRNRLTTPERRQIGWSDSHLRLIHLSFLMIVIYDLPPILQADDLLAFAPLVDAVLLVAAEGQTNRGELMQARDIFHEVNLLGVVLNKSVDEVEQYGY